MTDRRREDLTLDFKLVAGNFDGRDERKLLAKAISGWKGGNVPRTSVPSRCRFEDTGDPRPIEGIVRLRVQVAQWTDEQPDTELSRLPIPA